MLTLYGVYRSRATRNVWLMNELGLPFTHVPVIQGYRLADPAAPDAPLNTTSTAFLAINPAGQVPFIVDDGLVLSESLAINLYLAKKHGGPLAARDPGEEAQMMQWALFGATQIEQTALDIYYPYADGTVHTPDGAARIAAAAEKLARPVATLNAHLAATGHVVGGRFTVADINMAEIIRYASAHQPLMQANPLVTGWLAACQTRPAFQQMWAARTAEPA